MPHKTIIRLSGVARNPANGFPARLLDHLNRLGRSAAEVRDQAMQMPYVAFAFISPSQDGVKVHCLVDPAPTNRGEQTAAWEQVGQQLTKDLETRTETPILPKSSFS